MTRDPVDQLRLTAFAELRRVTERSGGVVSRSEMTRGFEFRGERIPFALRAVGIWRPRQLGRHGAPLSLTTAAVKRGVTPRYDDQIGSETGWFEYRYQGTDPSAWTNEAVVQAMKNRTPLIYFYGIVPGIYEAIYPVFVDSADPAALTFHLAADTPGLSEAALFGGGSEAPLKAYSTVAAKKRLHQRRFRELVVAAYARSCTVCKLRHAELLEAAHILPDRDERGLPEIPNGLSLCRIHHGAFDVGIIGISPDFHVHVRKDVLAEKDGPMLRHGLQEADGLKIKLPSREKLWPNRDYLHERFQRFRAA